jgi:hypothetical protein
MLEQRHSACRSRRSEDVAVVVKEATGVVGRYSINVLERVKSICHRDPREMWRERLKDEYPVHVVTGIEPVDGGEQDGLVHDAIQFDGFDRQVN